MEPVMFEALSKSGKRITPVCSFGWSIRLSSVDSIKRRCSAAESPIEQSNGVSTDPGHTQ